MEKSGLDGISTRVNDLCMRSERQLVPLFTQFLTPEEQVKARNVLKSFSDVICVELGGINDAERKMFAFLPEVIYKTPETDDELLEIEQMSEMAYVKIKGSGFVNFSHRDILGSLMALGVKRETLGDIIICDDNKTAYVVLTSTVANYLVTALERVARDKVKVSLAEKRSLPKKEQKYADLSVTLASLRADALISSVYNISRDKAKRMISAGLVLINHTECTSTDKAFVEKDVFSVKGEGKFIVDSFLGKTQKDRLKVVVRKYI